MSEIYTWRGGSGLFSDPNQWGYLSGDPTGGTVPGTGDDADIVGPTITSAYIVTGPGDAGSLLLEDNVALAGSINATALTLDADTIDMLAGAAVSAITLDAARRR